MNNRIYLDHAATTEVLPEVSYAMEPYLIKKYGNASTAYQLGKESKQALECARGQIADAIGADAEEIFFTSGGSEADNWAIKTIAGERKNSGRHIITSKIEHHAVLYSCEYLERLGYQVSYLDVTPTGKIDRAQLETLLVKSQRSRDLQEKVTLISIMYANNEIGTLEPVEEIGKIAGKRNILFHTDGVQAVGQVPMNLKKMPIDLLSASAHKFHGPKGAGFLYVKKGVEIPSFIHGGGQERGKRAGTENVAGIVGMAKALEMAARELPRTQRQLIDLRNYFVKRVLREIPEVRINGSMEERLPGNLNLSFKNVSGTALLVLLEEEGIYASAGSACSAGATTLSHVISAIDVPKEYAYGTIRFSLGRENTRKDVDITIGVLKRIIDILRS